MGRRLQGRSFETSQKKFDEECVRSGRNYFKLGVIAPREDPFGDTWDTGPGTLAVFLFRLHLAQILASRTGGRNCGIGTVS